MAHRERRSNGPTAASGPGGRGRLWLLVIVTAAAVVAAAAIVFRDGGRSGDAAARRRLALDRAAAHDPSAAAALIDLLAADPGDLEVVRALAAVALVADDPDAALHWLSRWHALEPAAATPPRLALEVAARTGRFEAVLPWADKLLATEADATPVLERLVPAELATGRFDSAVAHARELCRLRGDRDDDALLLARSLRAAGDETGARLVLEPLCRRSPPHAGAAALLAALPGADADPEPLIALLRAAIAGADADEPRAAQAARHELGKILARAGRVAEARIVTAEWERFEAARAAVIDAYQRPGDAALRRRAGESLVAARQGDRAAELLADLAAAATPRPPALPAPPSGPATRAAADPAADPAGCRFADVTPGSGVDFVHDGDATPDHLIQETMGSGVAWIDYDRDGRADLFCVQVTTPRSGAAGHRLYRNLGGGRFADVTRESGAGLAAYGMGAEVGDLDNDGHDDLVVSGLGGLSILRNVPAADGGRRFLDVSPDSGLVNPHWGTGLALLDVDGDALLDLYVANYVEIDPAAPAVCHDFRTGLPQSCTPTAYDHRRHRLFRNEGNFRFADATARWGLAGLPPAPGLGVVAADLDADGRCDLYVANDMRPAFLLRGEAGGFREVGLESGTSHGPDGRLMAGMGVVADDLDGSGRPSLFVTNFHFEPNVFFRAEPGGTFREWSHPSGLGGPSLRFLGFGAVALDADADGRLDLAVANGHVNRHAERISAAAFAQPLQLFLGADAGRFRDASAAAGPTFATPRVGRGLAVSDFDSDGMPDLVVTANGGPASLLRNTTATDNAWIRLALEGDGHGSNRSAIGARVEIETPRGRLTRLVCGGGSYLSASDRRLSIGLGPRVAAVTAVVHWPSGRRETFPGLAARADWRLAEGAGARRLDE